jgi:hypothetical protein
MRFLLAILAEKASRSAHIKKRGGAKGLAEQQGHSVIKKLILDSFKILL